MTHLLRPGARAALAAIELVLARREAGGIHLEGVERWADKLGKSERLQQTLRRADEMDLE